MLDACEARSSCAPSCGYVNGVRSICVPHLDRSSSLATVRSLQEASPHHTSTSTERVSPRWTHRSMTSCRTLLRPHHAHRSLLRGRQMPSSAITGKKSEFAEWVELRLGPWRNLRRRSPRSSCLLVLRQMVLAIQEHPSEQCLSIWDTFWKT